MLDFSRQFTVLREEIMDAIAAVCESQSLILGPRVAAFETAAASACASAFAIGCASGTDALWLALAAAGIGDSSSSARAACPAPAVITTPFSFFATASSILRSGARPVFADIDPRSFNLSPESVAEVLRKPGGEQVKAVLAVHLYGQCADWDGLEALKHDNPGLLLLEDAAQAFGAAWESPSRQGRPAGSLGLAAAFSFYPTKNLSAYGDAGAVTTNNPEMAEHMRRLRNHGMPRRYVHEEFGWNCRLDAMQAAILRVKLKYVEGWNQARRQRASAYDRLFAESGLARSQSTISNQQSTIPDDFPIHLPQTAVKAHHVFHQYVVRAYRRDELREFLTARKIGTEVYYPIPLHLQPCFAYLGYREGDFPAAERAAKEVLALPMFPELTEEEQRWVVKSIADFYC